MNPLRDSFNIIKRRKKVHYLIILAIMLVLFINAFFSGQHLYKIDNQQAEKIIEKIRSIEKLKFLQNLFEQKNYLSVFTFIFLNNFLIDVLIVYSGIIFLFTIFIPISNVSLLGLLLGITSMIPNGFAPLRLFLFVLVASMELSCMIIALYEGLRIGSSLVNPRVNNEKTRKKALKKAFYEASKILFLVALILIIAAIVETLGIVYLKESFLGKF